MATKDGQHVEHAMPTKAKVKTQASDYHSNPSATILKRPLPRASIERANKIFENFSLSKFPTHSKPPNYVHSHKKDASLHHAERMKRVRDFQNNKIKQHIEKLKKMAEKHPHKGNGGSAIKGITVAAPKDSICKILPSYNKEKETVVLDDVMGLITKYTRGTELYAKGNPTLNRLALLARVEKIKKSLGLVQHDQSKGEKK